jgi:predicted permease
MKRLWKRLRQVVRRRRFEAELADELRIHREMAEDAARGAGATDEEARRESARAFGGEALALEDSRSVWRFTWLDSLAQDVVYALRGFRKSPGFVLTVVGTLALGLGILATSFSVFSAMVLRPYAVRDPWSLYSFYWGNQEDFATWREFTDLRKQKTVFSDVIGVQTASVPIAGKPEMVEAVSGNYFTMLGGRICMGRPILESDDSPGAAAVAVASYSMWAHRFGRDPNIVGQKLYLAGRPAEVVGVACPEFNGLEPEGISAWVSLAASGTVAGGPDLFGPEQPARLMPVGRLKPGVTVAGAKAALLTYGRQVSGAGPAGKTPDRVTMMQRATIVPLTRGVITSFLPAFAAFGLILLIACANVSNMMLARCLARRREIGIRISLGAGRGRVVRQLLTESLLLALPAALAAFGVAWAAVQAVVWLIVNEVTSHGGAAGQTRPLDLSPDFRALVFLLAAAGIATLAFGLMPAIQATRSSLVAANRGEFTNDYRPSRLRNALVVVQVTVCSLLLISAAISLRSERWMASQDLGLDPRGGFSVVAAEKFRGPLAERLRSEPRVALVGAANLINLKAEAVGSGGPVWLPYMLVSPEYFDMYRVPVVRGRNFSEAEARAEADVAVISESAARKLWPGQEAVGRTVVVPQRQVMRGMTPWVRSAVVIGVVRDAIYGWDNEGQPQRACLFFPTHPASKLGVTLLVSMKSGMGIEQGRRIIESVVEEVAPGGTDRVMSLEELQAARMSPFRALFAITGFMGGLALLMTLSGIYGVLSYLVGQRRREFGIRIALGAEGKDVGRMVFRQSLKLAAGGAVLGALAAWGVARILTHVLGPTGPIDVFDWSGYAGGILVVIAAALAASWVPARRAVRIDPAVTLRCD